MSSGLGKKVELKIVQGEQWGARGRDKVWDAVWIQEEREKEMEDYKVKRETERGHGILRRKWNRGRKCSR